MLATPERGTREHILLWLASQPENATFNWASRENCACGMYSRSLGYKSGAWLENTNVYGMNRIAAHVADKSYRAKYSDLERMLRFVWGM
jgi:hypothetical protein